MAIHSLKDLLPSTVNRLGIKKQVSSSLILEEINRIIREVFPDNIAKKIRPLYIKNDTATLVCLSSEVMAEARVRERAILERLDQHKIVRLRYIM